MQMTVAAALAELKTLDARIMRGISTTTFVASSVPGDRVQGKTNAEFNRDSQAALDSVRALIDRRNRIKRAIVRSNASSRVSIGEIDMTVAEALEYRKHGYTYEHQLLTLLKRQWDSANSAMLAHNERVRSRVESDALKNNNLAAEGAARIVGELIQMALQKNGMELWNPINAQQVIEELERKLETFDAGFDVAINHSNHTTVLDIG